METLEPILAKHPFFEELEPKYLQLMVGCASNVRFGAGETIFTEGSDADQFYLIREGKVVVDVPAGKYEPVTIDVLRTGDVLGWSWLVPPYTWRFNARATEPTRAIALDGKCLRKKADEDHDLGYELLRRVVQITAHRLHATRLQLLETYHAWSELVDGRT
jgi:CRP/FNR family cyclic AMP-dependent transcriptional regulator